MQNNGKGFSVAALVLGILATILAWFYMVNIAALILGIVGIILAAKGRKLAKAVAAPPVWARLVCPYPSSVPASQASVSSLARCACCVRLRRYFGRLLTVYLLSYPMMRFCLEFLRGDALRGIWWGLSTSQWVSIILFSSAIAYLLRRRPCRTQ